MPVALATGVWPTRTVPLNIDAIEAASVAASGELSMLTLLRNVPDLSDCVPVPTVVLLGTVDRSSFDMRGFRKCPALSPFGLTLPRPCHTD